MSLTEEETMDTAFLIQSIARSKATLKIITKTKNERLFIEKWIQHHLAIIGEGKLIIFDNMSDDEYVLNIYEKYKENIILIKFSNYQDDIHNYELMKPFYQAIRNSTGFFTILDSDEYLYLYDEKTNTVVHDVSIQDFLKENEDCDFFAPCWLANKEKHENILNLTSELPSRFAWGKPIIHTRVLNNAQLDNWDMIMFRHTCELPSLHYTKAKTAFVIAHLKNLSLDQRITTSMNKLVSLGFLNSCNNFEELQNLTTQATEHEYMQRLIKSTKELVKRKGENGDYYSNTSAKENTLTIEENARLTFSHTFSQHAFRALMKRNYLDIIDYDGATISPAAYPRLKDWIEK